MCMQMCRKRLRRALAIREELKSCLGLENDPNKPGKYMLNTDAPLFTKYVSKEDRKYGKNKQKGT